MILTRNKYSISVIDEPLPKHIIAFEREVRKIKSESARHLLEDASSTLAIDFSSADLDALAHGIIVAARKVRDALDELKNAESLTATADDLIIVRSAYQSGWLQWCKREDENLALDAPEDLSPAWLIPWMARTISEQYVAAMTIPKN